jgi:hypothetical protein
MLYHLDLPFKDEVFTPRLLFGNLLGWRKLPYTKIMLPSQGSQHPITGNFFYVLVIVSILSHFNNRLLNCVHLTQIIHLQIKHTRIFSTSIIKKYILFHFLEIPLHSSFYSPTLDRNVGDLNTLLFSYTCYKNSNNTPKTKCQLDIQDMGEK